MSLIRIAAISLATVDGMVRENYARALRLGRIALAAAPDIILYPETFAAGYCGTDLTPVCEHPDSAYQRRFLELSRDGQCMVVGGYLEKTAAQPRNVAAIYDCGRRVGVHTKASMWPDDARPYRDERALLTSGYGIEVFPTRFGKLAVLICYENMLPENWDTIAGNADFVLSPYNCEGDPAQHNQREAARLRLPSAWADRTGTVYAGGDVYRPNPGTAGIICPHTQRQWKSDPGVETIVVGELRVP